ncbi:hypothetical protein Tco_0369005 [Tanacetum coccineum]
MRSMTFFRFTRVNFPVNWCDILPPLNKLCPQSLRRGRRANEKMRCFRCSDLNHLIGECLKPPKDKNQRAFIGGSWSDSSEEDDEKVKDETCLVAQASNEICLGVDLEPDEWIRDSGYFKDMAGNRKIFSTYKAYNGGNVIFCNNIHGNIIGKGQICDNNYRVTFSEHDSEITKDGKVIGRGIRKKGIYVMKLGNKPKDKICLATIDENSTLWHRRIKGNEKKNLENDIEDETLEIDEVVNIKESRNHPLENLDQEVVVEDNQILTREITDVMKTWVNIIRENVFCLGGNLDHVPV